MQGKEKEENWGGQDRTEDRPTLHVCHFPGPFLVDVSMKQVGATYYPGTKLGGEEE